MTEYFARDIAGKVLEALQEMPVVVVTGMRQTGKTTFLRNQSGFEERRYTTFDDFAQLAAAKSDPDLFVATDETLSIDEAHKCPEILTAIKRVVDRERRSGRFLLSGSANFLLLKGIRESLAGRSVYFEMYPFSRREIGRHTSEEPFLKRFFETLATPKKKDLCEIQPEDILKGGMPTVCLGQVQTRRVWFKGYEQTYLERDIREISQIGDIMAFRNLLRLTALRTGQLLSVSQLARDAKLTASTTSRYLSLFETSFVLGRLSPYLRNKASRLIKSPKLYLSDSGLACYLTEIKDIDYVSSDPLPGALLETYVAQNLLSLVNARWTEARVYFWNVQGRYEVDFIIEAGTDCVALEIKSGARWENRDLSGLKAFLSATPRCKAGILGYNGTEVIRLGDKLWVLPLSLVLS